MCSGGTSSTKSKYGSSSTFCAFIRPCRTALSEAWRMSPPSVCFRWVLPAISVIFTSVRGEPVSTPRCLFSMRLPMISLCQLRSSSSVLTAVS